MAEKIEESDYCDSPRCQNKSTTKISVRDKFRSMKLNLCYDCQGKIMHLVHQIWELIEVM